MRQVPNTTCWIGNARDYGAHRELFDRGIEAVVQLAAEEPVIATPRELMCFRLPLLDGAGNDPARLKLAINVVAQLIAAGIPTLVSCSAGMSRSPAIVAAALAQVEQADVGEVLLRVIADGPREVSAALWREILQLVRRG